ncbi:ribbon-helix-helix domain-containing protein [Candidatus Nanohalococcus occultus]|uniref:CopG/MetJ, RHH domain containing DNA-binding protein, often an antitoxin in Type II toxin-antitoxin systems n=1 Tax=Candidatus Nanohalococcus occultus TaxID=2978047 RepID=A0ABY8CHH4_9ARCH|nr:CopG/MetJ, RHH domain containing DNA-binding protein, often an antitoxin in Type II toxin-antitoxin systems [Candidatus Nanohaloarchaeota archaeon SVXNc]
MPSTSINLPEGLKKQLEERLERGDYQNTSEFIREAIREKLKRETQLHPKEIQRIMNVRERERKGEQKWIPFEQVKEELGIE